MKKTELNPLLHALATAQILTDELSNIEGRRLSYYRNEFKQATKNWIRAAKKTLDVLGQIWDAVPMDDFDAYLEAKKRVILRLQQSEFEVIREVDAMITDAHHKAKMLDIIERILNTHCLPEVAEMYRNELGYTKEQYEILTNSRKEFV